MQKLLSVAVLFSTLGCAAMQADAVRVTALTPRPSIDLPAGNVALAFDLGAIPDSFEIPEQNGVTPVPVEQWRTTLWRGFWNGMKPFYSAANGTGAPGPGAELTVKLLKADLEYTPVAIYRGGGAAAVVARITYMAQIVDRDGNILGRLKGEALSRNPWTTMGGSQSTATEAVNAMFEEIADKGLRQITSVKPATPAATGVTPTRM
jgi:hypothetical protein